MDRIRLGKYNENGDSGFTARKKHSMRIRSTAISLRSQALSFLSTGKVKVSTTCTSSIDYPLYVPLAARRDTRTYSTVRTVIPVALATLRGHGRPCNVYCRQAAVCWLARVSLPAVVWRREGESVLTTIASTSKRRKKSRPD